MGSGMWDRVSAASRRAVQCIPADAQRVVLVVYAVSLGRDVERKARAVHLGGRHTGRRERCGHLCTCFQSSPEPFTRRRESARSLDHVSQPRAIRSRQNHLSYGDYYLVQSLAARKGMLGRCRYFVKKQIVWQIPLFGWAFWTLGMILVSRNWTNDSRLIE